MSPVARWSAFGLMLALASGCEKAPEPSSPSSSEPAKEASKELPKKSATSATKKPEPVDDAVATAPLVVPKLRDQGKGADEKPSATGTMPVKPDKEPDHVKVQHILIAFRGAPGPGQKLSRTKEDAQKLAHEILDRARAGENFDELMKQYSNDEPPGIYSMANNGITAGQGEYARSGMVGAFGNVGFAISPGNIDIAEYDPKTSPFGWHIIKRLE
ncbi:MAG: peptidylprolyl isomerase [Planctomycetes bacterium]|nr:peptidylprolyl isomerase [Planctomycetota bacterium]